MMPAPLTDSDKLRLLVLMIWSLDDQVTVRALRGRILESPSLGGRAETSTAKKAA